MHRIDVETTALRPAEGKLRLVQLSDGKKAKIYDAFEQDAEAIRRAIEEHDELVAHNAVFEREWLNVALAVDRPDLHDTMIMSQVYHTGTRAAKNSSFSHSLAADVDSFAVTGRGAGTEAEQKGTRLRVTQVEPAKKVTDAMPLDQREVSFH